MLVIDIILNDKFQAKELAFLFGPAWLEITPFS
jgi:hypothetical protein